MRRAPDDRDLENMTGDFDNVHRSVMRWLAIAAVLCMIIIVTLIATAGAHDAPSGWSYPFSCCSTNDCRRVPADWISEQPAGFAIVMTGEVVGYQDPRVRTSPDGEFHWCSVAGDDNSRTICLFVPPRGF